MFVAVNVRFAPAEQIIVKEVFLHKSQGASELTHITRFLHASEY